MTLGPEASTDLQRMLRIWTRRLDPSDDCATLPHAKSRKLFGVTLLEVWRSVGLLRGLYCSLVPVCR